MSHDLPPDLIAKWMAGALSPHDQRLLDDWLSVGPARAAELEDLREVWHRAGQVAEAAATGPDPAEPARWAAINAAISRSQADAPTDVPNRVAVRPIMLQGAGRRSRILTWAAAVVL